MCSYQEEVSESDLFSTIKKENHESCQHESETFLESPAFKYSRKLVTFLLGRKMALIFVPGRGFDLSATFDNNQECQLLHLLKLTV